MIVRLLSLSLLLVAGAAQGLPAARTLGQMTHTRWTTDDGAPSAIQALVQTRDGFLWIGSSAGLYRFDGLTFERIPTIGPESSVTALLGTRDGRLFIGLQNGHLLLLRGGVQTDVTPSTRAKYIRKIVEDRVGGIWLQTIAPDLGLARYFESRWTRYGPARGVPEDALIKTTIATHDGAVWVLTQNLLLVLKPGRSRFDIVLPALDDKIEDIFEDASGNVWAADHNRGLRSISASSALAVDFTDRANLFRRLFVDRDGDIWGSVSSYGIFRIVPSDRSGRTKQRVERYGSAQGLSSDGVNAIIEDREGTIWVGTSGGLDRFRPANVVLEEAIPAKPDYGYGLFADHSGTIYITEGDTLYQVLPGGSPVALLKNINNPMTLCEGAPGDIWIAATGAIYVVHRGVAQKQAPPTDSDYMRCQGDRDRRPWFLTTMGEFFRRDGVGWNQQQLTKSRAPATRFTFDPQGRPLVFYENLGVIRRDGAKLSTIWPVNRIPGGRVGPLYQGSYGVIVGGVSGLARIRGDRVDVLGKEYPWLQHVTGIAETGRGDTWLQTSLGIFRVATADLQRAFDRPGSALKPTKFDAHDGLRGGNLIDYADNGSAVGGDGRVWFTTAAGIVWIDPARLLRNGVPPPVVITRVTADGVRSVNTASISLLKGTRSVEIDYAALSLAVPERAQFRYRMDGVDDHWIDPGTRRQAFYQNLSPGTYSFTVIAANNDGVWNKQGATMKLTLPPTFLQSWPFKLLCAGAALMLLWLLYQVRLSRITTRLREQLETRLVERERIARELHDTLLQGVHGLILRFQGIADRLPREQVPGRLMEKALERAEELLVEGRERVHGLRSGPLHADLKTIFLEAASQASLSPQTAINVHESRGARMIDPVVREELVGVVREALSNVARHAGASAVEIGIAHTWNRLIVSIADNGAWVEAIDRPGSSGRHFGIIGMRERARRVGGTLKIQRGAGESGTRVSVAVPARIAYPSHIVRRLRGWLGIGNLEPAT